MPLGRCASTRRRLRSLISSLRAIGGAGRRRGSSYAPRRAVGGRLPAVGRGRAAGRSAGRPAGRCCSIFSHGGRSSKLQAQAPRRATRPHRSGGRSAADDREAQRPGGACTRRRGGHEHRVGAEPERPSARQRSLKRTVLAPAWPSKTRVPATTVRVQACSRRRRAVETRHRVPTRRPAAPCVKFMRTAAGSFRSKLKVVPTGVRARRRRRPAALIRAVAGPARHRATD